MPTGEMQPVRIQISLWVVWVQRMVDLDVPNRLQQVRVAFHPPRPASHP